MVLDMRSSFLGFAETLGEPFAIDTRTLEKLGAVMILDLLTLWHGFQPQCYGTASAISLVETFPARWPYIHSTTIPLTIVEQDATDAQSSAEKIIAYSSEIQIPLQERDGNDFERVIEAARACAFQIGRPSLADAVDEVYERSRFDRTLRILLRAVLTQRATTAQENVFKSYCRANETQAPCAQSNPQPTAIRQSETGQDQEAATSCRKDQDATIQPGSANFLPGDSLGIIGGTGTEAQDLTSTASSAIAMETELPPPSEIICFGMVPDVKCKMLDTSRSVATVTSGPTTKYQKLDYTMKRGRFIVGIESCRELACLNSRITNVLFEILQVASAGCEMFLGRQRSTSTLSKEASRGESEFLYIDINILGFANACQRVGEVLSRNEFYLQDPLSADMRKYVNPQVLDLGVSASDMLLHELFVNMAAKWSKTDHGSDWNTALDGMSQHALDASAVKVDTSIVTTLLLPHQGEALDFMFKRELGQEFLEGTMRFWRHDSSGNGNAVYRHRITADERAQPQAEPQGGILADEMGLGKTLTAISLIVSSISRRNHFASQLSVQPGSRIPTSQLRTRATLVAVPSTQLMDSWLEQLQQHTRIGKLKVIRYHGHERVCHGEELLDYDVVITTYGTIAKEHSKASRKVLYHLHFFRIILDEAHIIRTRRTKLFVAVTKLVSAHQWCLTGTPISNRIDDLYSLLNFCRVPLLEDEPTFRQHVATPSKKSFSRGCSILREALKPICLRRNKDIIGLAHPEAIEKEVEFSRPESEQYHRISQKGKRALDAGVSGRMRKSARNVMLRILLELRIFCSQGTLRQDRFMADEQSLDSDELFTFLEESEDAYCVSCRSEITGINQIDDESSGVLGACSHVLCATCYTERDQNAASIECPTCKQPFRAQDLQAGDGADTSSAAAKRSCKMDSLVQDLLSSQNAQAPEKSIVFSYRRKTIDIAADLCSRSRVRAVVVHGKIPQADRTGILERFAEDPTISALLMTIGTGGLGLTINAASRVHLLEPQWNPFVEDQAIGRVVRLGQEKPVTVIRYIVKDSVERQIQGYQNRKKALAASGFGHRSDHTSTEENVRLNAAYIS
ncbi:hypothetical protein BST61_g3986 [Cercospora zeina]